MVPPVSNLDCCSTVTSKWSRESQKGSAAGQDSGSFPALSWLVLASCIASALVWKSPSSKNRLSASERVALDRLSRVHRLRQPFEGLSRRLISESLAHHLPPEGPV